MEKNSRKEKMEELIRLTYWMERLKDMGANIKHDKKMKPVLKNRLVKLIERMNKLDVKELAKMI